MGNKLFINCDEATTICTKNQYKEASLWEKLKLNIHILNCKICARYAKQNSKLTDVCSLHLHKPQKPQGDHKLSNNDKDALKEKLKQMNQ